MEYVSFHTHTGYSYADGFGPVLSHVERVAALGMSALFLSEHGNVNSHAALERHCRAVGIKVVPTVSYPVHSWAESLSVKRDWNTVKRISPPLCDEWSGFKRYSVTDSF
jgi:DNA polymerase III alpha subunit